MLFDAFSEARKHATQMREFYDAYVSAGFTEEQAFRLTEIMMMGASRVNPR